MLAGIAREAGMTVRAFNRDANLDVMDAFLTGGKRRVPVFAVFDGELEIARWIERPAVAEPIMQDIRRRYPPADSPDREDLMRPLRQEMAERLDAAGAAPEVVREVRGALARGLGSAG